MDVCISNFCGVTSSDKQEKFFRKKEQLNKNFVGLSTVKEQGQKRKNCEITLSVSAVRIAKKIENINLKIKMNKNWINCPLDYS